MHRTTSSGHHFFLDHLPPGACRHTSTIVVDIHTLMVTLVYMLLLTFMLKLVSTVMFTLMFKLLDGVDVDTGATVCFFYAPPATDDRWYSTRPERPVHVARVWKQYSNNPK